MLLQVRAVINRTACLAGRWQEAGLAVPIARSDFEPSAKVIPCHEKVEVRKKAYGFNATEDHCAPCLLIAQMMTSADSESKRIAAASIRMFAGAISLP